MAASYLIVRFSAIGDCVMAAYVATGIRVTKPDAKIVWAVETRCMPVLDRNRLLSGVVDFPRDRWRRRRWSPASWREQIAAFAKLRKERFDYGLDLQGHSKTAICLRIACPVRRMAAFATDGVARRLNPLAPGDPDGKHRVERMLDTARSFGEFEAPETPLMPPVATLSELNIPTDRPIASISTGAGAVNKQYPANQWSDVAKGLDAKGFQVVLLGATVDPAVEAPKAIDMVGKLPLDKTMSVVANSAIHLAADTGTGHMAAAYGVPFVSVFGPTNPMLYRPYSDQGVVLRASDRPKDVSPGEIVKAAEGLLA